MRLDLITHKDWVEFRRRYSDAYSFLEDASLINEREHLRRERDERPLMAWKRRRLEELDQWYQNVHVVQKEEV